MPIALPAPPNDPSANPWVELSLQGEANIFDANTSGAASSVGSWVGTGCAVATGGPQPTDGSFPIKLTSSGTGAFSVQSGDIACQTGMAWTGTAVSQAASTGQSFNVSLVWKDGLGATISTSAGLYSSDYSGGYSLAYVTAQAPTGAVTVAERVSFLAAAAGGEIHYVASRAINPGTLSSWSPGGNAGTETALVESSDDQGATWQALRYGVGVALPAPAQQANVIDWDINPNTARLYRVTITTAGGLQSAPSTPIEAIVSPRYPWLLDVIQPGPDAKGQPGRVRLPRLRGGGISPGGVPSQVDWVENEQMASAYGLDESMPVTTRGAILGRTTSLVFYADSLAQYQAVRALRKRQRTLRVVLPGFEAAYVIIGGGGSGGTSSQVTYSQLRTGDQTHYAVTVPLTETAAP